MNVLARNNSLAGLLAAIVLLPLASRSQTPAAPDDVPYIGKAGYLYHQFPGVWTNPNGDARLRTNAALAQAIALLRSTNRDANLPQAEKLISDAADQGDLTGLFLMGWRAMTQWPERGGTIVESPDEAREWYTKAVAAGSIRAAFQLGELYYFGKVARDYAVAAKWYEMAAAKGNVVAMERLADLYSANHEDVHGWFKADPQASEKWRLQAEAARQGGPPLSRPPGPSPSELAANKMLPPEVFRDNPELAARLGRFGFTNAPVTNTSPTPGGQAIRQTAMGRRPAFNRPSGVFSPGFEPGGRFRPDMEAVTGMNSESALKLARSYEEGGGQTSDPAKAADLYFKIAGNARGPESQQAIDGLVRLAAADRIQEATEPGSNGTHHYLRWLPELAYSPETRLHLADLYWNGCAALPPNATNAIEWYTLAAQAGSAQATYRMGQLWASGVNSFPDLAEAVRWYRAAANLGLADAQAELGRAYLNGAGISKNEVEAVYWLNLASKGSATLPPELADVESKLTLEQRKEIAARIERFQARLLRLK